MRTVTKHFVALRASLRLLPPLHSGSLSSFIYSVRLQARISTGTPLMNAWLLNFS